MSADQGANIEGREENNKENEPIVDLIHESQDKALLHETITAKAKDLVTSDNIETESSSNKNDSVQDASAVVDVDLLKEQNHNKDDKICVMHVGPHKTGSTTLQGFFLNKDSQQSREALKQDNYEVPIFPNRGFFH